MPRLRRLSALLLGSALAIGALTSVAAYADDTTATSKITVDAALTALVDARTATDAAAADGWAATLTDTELDGTKSAVDLAYDATVGRGSISGQDGGEPFQTTVVDHGGSYETLVSYRGSGSARRYRRALAMIGRAGASWVQEPVDPQTADLAFDDYLGPLNILEILTDSQESKIGGTPTATAEADGSTTYGLNVTLIDGGDDHGSMTITVGADGVLAADTRYFDGEQTSSTYAYGPQDVPLPDPSDAVSEHDLDEALALLGMGSDARMIADEARVYAIKGRHPHLSDAQTVRRYAKSDARTTNGMYGAKVFATRDIARGVRVTGTNPFTREQVVFTVRAIGKRVVVRRA